MRADGIAIIACDVVNTRVEVDASRKTFNCLESRAENLGK